MLTSEAVARIAAREGEDDFLARNVDSQAAPSSAEHDLLCDLLEAIRSAPVARCAWVGHLGRRVRRSAEREIDDYQQHGCGGRQRDRPHQTLTSRLPSTIGMRASRPSKAAARKERENAFVAARSS